MAFYIAVVLNIFVPVRGGNKYYENATFFGRDVALLGELVLLSIHQNMPENFLFILFRR